MVTSHTFTPLKKSITTYKIQTSYFSRKYTFPTLCLKLYYMLKAIHYYQNILSTRIESYSVLQNCVCCRRMLWKCGLPMTLPPVFLEFTVNKIARVQWKTRRNSKAHNHKVIRSSTNCNSLSLEFLHGFTVHDID